MIVLWEFRLFLCLYINIYILFRICFPYGVTSSEIQLSWCLCIWNISAFVLLFQFNEKVQKPIFCLFLTFAEHERKINEHKIENVPTHSITLRLIRVVCLKIYKKNSFCWCFYCCCSFLCYRTPFFQFDLFKSSFSEK